MWCTIQLSWETLLEKNVKVHASFQKVMWIAFRWLSLTSVFQGNLRNIMVRTSHWGGLINLIIRCPGYLLRLCVERRLVAWGIWHLGWYLDAWKPPSILDKKAKSVLEPNSAWSQNLSCFIRLLKPRPLNQQSSPATISLVVQRLHNTIQRINYHPADEC